MALTYTCEHIDGDRFTRSGTLTNPHLDNTAIKYTLDPNVKAFHHALQDYRVTPLHELPTIAAELGLGKVFLKDESLRLGLPSFKSTGAFWAVFRVLCQHAGVSHDSITIEQLKTKLSTLNPVLVTCTAGNWGRAVGKIACLLGVRAKIFVPGACPEYTQNLIRQEGAEVIHLKGMAYDETLATTVEEAKKSKGILVVDVDCDGCGEVPKWVSDGYHTIMQEVDEQLRGQGVRPADLVSCSCGAGSWAQAVVSHYKTQAHPTRVVTVEPDQAASLKEALHEGKLISVKTGDTIMNGMNCGTVSACSWPTLRAGVDISTVVTDVEAHQAALELKTLGINAGPCGAANLAALRRVCKDVDMPGKDKMIVVLYSSEGMREYVAPE